MLLKYSINIPIIFRITFMRKIEKKLSCEKSPNPLASLAQQAPQQMRAVSTSPTARARSMPVVTQKSYKTLEGWSNADL
jgi:ribosomal protein L34E